MNVGIDLGSRSVKLIVLDDDNNIIDSHIYDSISFYNSFRKKTKDHSLELDLTDIGVPMDANIAATGYGKHNLQIKGVNRISEQKAHMFGAIHQTGLKDFTLLDIGGQDTKIIKVVGGKMLDVYMNDKCGASSGRYIENMATVLNMSLDEISSYYEDPEKFSNTCAVFGESEVLGKIFEGVAIEKVAAGVNYSVYDRLSSFLFSMISDSPIVFVGGVSKNRALQEIIQNSLKVEIVVPKFNQFNGALGATVFNSVQ